MIASLAIAQVTTSDGGGGAAAVVRDLHRGYAARGHRAWQIVGRRQTRGNGVLTLPDDERPLWRVSGYALAQRGLRHLAGRFPDRGFGFVSRALRLATHPGAVRARRDGREDFDFPGTSRLLELNGARPDILHAHNLHGGYFDLRALQSLSAQLPTVVTLHDMWLLTGHCAHAMSCDRWKTGCGSCPDLHLEPAIRRDGTADNWKCKQAIYAASGLHAATPSRWLRDQVAASMLAPHLRALRVIPNGVETAVFHPAERRAVRAKLDLPEDAAIVLLTTGSRGSMWKDDHTLRSVMARLSDQPATADVLFLAVGRESAVSGAGRARTRSIPFQHDPRVMAQFYQAADLYLHAARADTFPLAVLESMACGTPVIATAVGGIPEQIEAATPEDVREGRVGEATGMLVAKGDAARMAQSVTALLAGGHVRATLGANAAARVRSSFDVRRQVGAYLDWFQELVA